MTIRMSVNGTEYPVGQLLTGAKIEDLVAMKLHLDLSLPELERRMQRLEQLPNGWLSVEIYEHPDLMQAKAACAWLVRRNAGVRVPITEAMDIELLAVFLVGDPEDMEATEEQEPDADADPTSASTAEVDAAPPAEPTPSSRRKPRTSKPTS